MRHDPRGGRIDTRLLETARSACVHEPGRRLPARSGMLSAVAFSAQNHTSLVLTW